MSPSQSQPGVAHSGAINSAEPAAVLDTTCFGENLDRAVRSIGSWPRDAVAFAVEVLNAEADHASPDAVQILVTGAVPLGHDAKGRFVWAKGKAMRKYRAVISLSQYRAGIALTGQSEAMQHGNSGMDPK